MEIKTTTKEASGNIRQGRRLEYVGALIGKELVEVLKQTSIDIACVQETN